MALGDNGRHHSITLGDAALLVNHTVKNEVLHRCPSGSPLSIILKHLNKGKKNFSRDIAQGHSFGRGTTSPRLGVTRAPGDDDISSIFNASSTSSTGC